jgi:hypothetical protein
VDQLTRAGTARVPPQKGRLGSHIVWSNFKGLNPYTAQVECQSAHPPFTFFHGLFLSRTFCRSDGSASGRRGSPTVVFARRKLAIWGDSQQISGRDAVVD